jgi:hypothetical protein
MEKDLAQSCERFQRSLKLQKLSEDRKYVINQAVELEKQKGKLETIPQEEWPNFIDDLKETRPVWPDFGLKPKDCSLDLDRKANVKLIEKNLKNLSVSGYKKNNRYDKFSEEESSSDDDEEGVCGGGDSDSVSSAPVPVEKDKKHRRRRRSYAVYHR